MMPLLMPLKNLALVAALLIFSAVPAAAETWNLQYAGLLGRMKLMTANVQVDVAHGVSGIDAFNVSMQAASDSSGAGALMPFTMQLEANGGRRGDALRPLWHRSTSVAWQKQQRVEMDYGADGSVTTFVDPPTRETREALAAGMDTGTIDPVTAAMILIDQVLRNNACDGHLPTFDGIRRYDLTVLGSEASALPAPILASVGTTGTPVACRFSIGYRSGMPAYATRASFYPREVTIWFAPLADGGQILPIVATADLSIGQLRLELLSASTAN